jgi:branched-chain amino acid transport system permease protein
MRATWRRPRTGGLLTLALAIALLPWFLPNAFFFDVAINVGLAAIVCVGLNLLIGYAGQISLGHAGFFGLGAYCSAILTGRYDWPPLLALACGMLLVGVLAFAVARPILRLKGHYLAMATLGLGIIIAIVLNQETALTGGPDGMPVGRFSIFGLAIQGEWMWYWLVGGALLVTVWLALNLIESPIGRALRAVHGARTRRFTPAQIAQRMHQRMTWSTKLPRWPRASVRMTARPKRVILTTAAARAR